MRIKVFFSSFFFSAFFIFTVSVGAQTTSITGTTDSAVTTTRKIPPPRPPAIQVQRDLILKNRLETKTMMKDKREELKKNLQIIRDERKKAIVERIDEKIYTMNQTHTARFSTVLEKLEMVLNKISDKVQKVKEIPAGINTSAVDSAIAAAQARMDAAKAAVSVQSAKVYSIEVINESTLRSTVGSVVSMFRKDLRDVHKIIVDAKQAVQKAEKELAKIRGEKIESAGEK